VELTPPGSSIVVVVGTPAEAFLKADRVKSSQSDAVRRCTSALTDDSTESLGDVGKQIVVPLAGDLMDPGFKHYAPCLLSYRPLRSRCHYSGGPVLENVP
jgi:hypothetical protein